MRNNSNSGGTGVIGLLGVSFVVLKLTGYIEWSWWGVTLPFWGSGVILIVAMALALLAEEKKRARRIDRWKNK